MKEPESGSADGARTTGADIGPGEGPATADACNSRSSRAEELQQLAEPAWLNGLAEAASELRRHLLDRLRGGELERAEGLLGAMEDVYDLLVTIDYPDAMTGGLRRTTDALRAVLERSRSDLTTTLLQARLQAAIEGREPPAGDYPRRAQGV